MAELSGTTSARKELSRRAERAWLAAIVLVAMLLHLPALGLGFFADDHTLALVFEGDLPGASMRPWNAFDFGERPEAGDLAWQHGGFPWWTSADWKLRFFRPLASLSAALDHALFGRWAAGHHLESLALFALLLVSLSRLYRALGFPAGAALLATALFAAEDSSLVPVAWLANRNSLLELLATVLAVLAALRARAGAWCLVATLVASSLALASKESGVAAPVLAALALASRARREPGFERTGALGVRLCAALAVLWIGSLLAAGYGSHSAFYPTPWGAPAAFGARLAVLLPLGGLALLTPYVPDLVVLFPGALWPSLAAAALIVPACAIAIARRVRGDPAVPLLAAWILISILPQAGTLPSNRLLFGAAVGSSGLLAIWLSRTLGRGSDASRGARLFAGAFALLALPVSGALVVLGGRDLSRSAAGLERTIRETEVGPRELGLREAILLQSPNAIYALSPFANHRSITGDREVRFWPLQSGRRGVRWTRVDERSFDLETLDEPFLALDFERVFLSSTAPPPPGTRWRTALFEVTALRSGPGGLTAFRVTLDRALEDPCLRFLSWRDGAMRSLAPPAVGETLELAPLERTDLLLP